MKKLYIMLTLVLFTGSMIGQVKPESKTKTVVARYDGSATDTFFFTSDVNNTELKFQKISEDLNDIYDLEDDNYIGTYFRLTYTIEFIENTSKMSNEKLQAAKNPFVKVLTIIEMEELKNYKEE